ncbi:MAG: hypothetical protein NY202_02470 [Mollicutes bacterium UO1]
MDLAYYGKDYDLPQSKNTTRQGHPSFAAAQKSPNVNLKFDEVVNQSRKATLYGYYEALKLANQCCWKIPADDESAFQVALDYNEPATKSQIDDGYQLASQ